MKKLRRLLEKYERVMLIGVVLIVLVIFTVTDQIMAVLQPTPEDAITPTEVAGSFQILPGEKVDVTWREFGRADEEWSWYYFLETGAQPDRRRTLEVWRHLLLREAAEREGITVSDADVVEYLRTRVGSLAEDPARYKQTINRVFRAAVGRFEEGIRGALEATRMREVYRVSFENAPPAPREEVVEQYASLNLEYARISALVYPAALELEAARTELQADADPDKTLKTFYETDPLVTADPLRFRHPRRYRLELLYVPHKRMDTPEDYQRIEDLFFRTFEELEGRRDMLEEELSVDGPGGMRDYYGSYGDRLLERDKEAWEEKQAEIRAAREQDGDAGGGEEGGDEPAAGPTAEELEEALEAGGFAVVTERIIREQKLRAMMWYIRDEAARDPSRSLKHFFDLLKEHDDPDDPIVSDEPDGGLIVYREFDRPLTGDELEDIEAEGVRFTHNFRNRVNQIDSEELPAISLKADIYGEQGDGRIVFRLIDVENERRKTYAELTEGDKQELREDFYLPEKARQRARAKLSDLRDRLAQGEEGPDRDTFLAAAGDLGPADRVRTIRNEWIEASYETLAQPERSLYWTDAWHHMRDRYFLHTELAGVLGRDRAERTLGPGSLLAVQVHQRSEPSDPGAAYLVMLHERREPSAATMPHGQFDRYLTQARLARINAERSRWVDNPRDLLSAFLFEFSDEMKERVEAALQQRDEARRRATQN